MPSHGWRLAAMADTSASRAPRPSTPATPTTPTTSISSIGSRAPAHASAFVTTGARCATAALGHQSVATGASSSFLGIDFDTTGVSGQRAFVRDRDGDDDGVFDQPHTGATRTYLRPPFFSDMRTTAASLSRDGRRLLHAEARSSDSSVSIEDAAVCRRDRAIDRRLEAAVRDDCDDPQRARALRHRSALHVGEHQRSADQCARTPLRCARRVRCLPHRPLGHASGRLLHRRPRA